MEHHFPCQYKCSCGSLVTWHASWELAGGGDDTVEILIRMSTSSYLVILGCSAFHGLDYICIPELHAGMELDSLKKPSHTEYLLSEYCHLDRRTAVTISQGLFHFFTYRHREI